MIAKPDACNVQQLPLLLSDQLEPRALQRAVAHLDHCRACQQHLEELASAGGAWWSDTQQVLAEITQAEIRSLANSNQATDQGQPHLSNQAQTLPHNLPNASEAKLPGQAHDLAHGSVDLREHWVLGLLDPPSPDAPATHPNSPNAMATGMGTIDGMPVLSVIGQGGMGVVLKARDEHLQRWLAIKLLSPMLASSGAARQRFLREAQAAAAVVHPNIVPIYAVSAERRLPYLVMPYVAGGNLQQQLDSQGPLPVERVLSIGLQVAEGLVAAHQQGIVHRDIKPANLMLDEGGFRVMLTDFGLARALDDATLTGSGLLAGTPQFMSPEQAAGRGLDHRSDLYSLGAVLYTLATGRPPVDGASTLETLRKLGQRPPRAIIEINESYPRWFQEMVGLFMVTDVERRIQTASEAVELLRACLAHARSPHQVKLPRAVAENLWPPRWLSTLAIGATGAGSLALLAFAAWNLLQPQSSASSANSPSRVVSTPPTATTQSPAENSAAAAAESRDTAVVTTAFPPKAADDPAQLQEAPLTADFGDGFIEASLWQAEQELDSLRQELGLPRERGRE